MNETELEFAAVQLMIRQGGSFVSALGKAWLNADLSNQRRLRSAFPEYLAE
jgi:hypothetical protein